MDGTTLLICAVIWAFLWGGLAHEIGKKKGQGIEAFISGFVLGPLGVLTVWTAKGNRVECPFCKQLMDPTASVCSCCHRDVPARKAA